MEYIVVLNYNLGIVYCKQLTESDSKLLESGVQTFFDYYQLNASECSWMFTNKKPELIALEREE